MSRPDLRPMKRLPVLEPRRSALETCVFCPKLCRSACPVSNAEPRETLTPWGKMSSVYFTARADVPADPSHAAPAWACTGCMACREACDHRNDVTSTLFEARSALASKGLAPAKAERALARYPAHVEATRQAARELAGHPATRADAPNAFLIGCAYVRGAMREARHGIDGLAALLGESVAVVEECCGLPLLLAGDKAAFAAHAAVFARARRAGRGQSARRLFVADAGCAMALRTQYPAAGVPLDVPVELLVERAARELASLRRVESVTEGPIRYHDPCQLGRGLGLYEEPRAVLTRALGRAPDEFDERREQGACSGGGGLLPTTMREVSREIASSRLGAHERLGGGRIVTACASSLLSLRQRSSVPVDDLMTWIALSAAPQRVRA